MNKAAKLSIQKREPGSKGAMNQLRKSGFLPGSISRKGSDAITFSVRKDELRKALSANGTSAVYTLEVDKKTSYPVMVREIQYAPLTRDWLHVTFQLVSLTEETTAEVPLALIGRDDVIHKGYELFQQLETLLLKGLPGQFPASVDINVSELSPGDQITVADLTLPEGVVSETEEDRLILSVSYPKVQEERDEDTDGAAVDAVEQPADEESKA